MSESASVFRALLFDLDDTLFDRSAAFARWVRQYVGKVDEDAMAWLIELDDRGRRPRAELATHVISRFGLVRAVDDLVASFPTELAAQVEPESGVREVIEEVAVGRRIAVVSNGSSSAQRTKLSRAGLSDLFPAVLISGELGVAKPAPAMFERALRWAEVDARECLFIGDDPETDLVPAAALGLATAWRARGAWPTHLAPPQFTLRSIAELRAVCA